MLLNQKVIDYAFDDPFTGTMGCLFIICIQRVAALKGSVAHLVETAWFDSDMLDNLIAWLQFLRVKKSNCPNSIGNAALEQASQFRHREHCHFYLADNPL